MDVQNKYMRINNNKLLEIRGGAVSATVINAIARAGTFLYELGRNLGTAVRMIGKKKTC